MLKLQILLLDCIQKIQQKTLEDCCGVPDISFTRIFSDSVDERFKTAAPKIRSAAIAIATECFGYQTQKQRVENFKNETCRHNFTINTCPLGCCDFEARPAYK